MDTIELHYLLGFNIFLAVVFTSLVVFIAVKRFHILHMRYLSFVLAILATTWFLDNLLMVGLSPEAYFMVELFYAFVMWALPFTLVLTILAFTGALARLPALRVKLDIVSFITSILFTLGVALVWPSQSVVFGLINGLLIVVIAILIAGSYLLVRALKGGTQHKMRLQIILAFILTNLIGVPISEALSIMPGQSLLYVFSETVVMTSNTLLMIFFILYIDPQEAQEDRYESLSRKFEDVMNYAGDGIAILDDMGKVISCNLAFAGLLGASPDGLKGRMLTKYIPPGQAPAVRNAISIGQEGRVAKDVRHNFIRKAGKDAGGGLSNHVVSTFSPIKSPDGIPEGVLVVTRDTTSVVLLEVEHLLRSRAEAQNQLQGLMTSLMPVLLAGSAGGLNNRGLYLNMLLNKVEKVLAWEGSCNACHCDTAAGNGGSKMRNCAPTVQDHLCNVMNNLGGSFYWEEIGPDEGHGGGKNEELTRPGALARAIVFYGMDCPWDGEARKNPLLCNLCRGIFTRLLIKVDQGANIELVSTIGNGDARCEIRGHWAANEGDDRAPAPVVPIDEGRDDQDGGGTRSSVGMGNESKEVGT